jgi:2-polyprenyl-3-methyl-5-hydroxy-6-metoxy-1,4-benzoquinol methylase
MKNKFNLFKVLFPNLSLISYHLELSKILKDCRSLLDIGCGVSSPTRFFSIEKTVGTDIHLPSVHEAKRKGTHHEIYLCDIKDISKNFAEKEFECCIALDVIEHLSKEDGYKLISDMERIASKKVVISTPNGLLPQKGESGDFQEHISGYNTDEMRRLGYRVIGILGHRFLRGEKHYFRFRPHFVAMLISEASQYLYARWHPEKAAALLCTKILPG